VREPAETVENDEKDGATIGVTQDEVVGDSHRIQVHLWEKSQKTTLMSPNEMGRPLYPQLGVERPPGLNPASAQADAGVD
jgi:hypothetical protein